MADQEDDDLQMALQMSLSSPPEPKRSKPQVGIEVTVDATMEATLRHVRRELMAAAAEKRMTPSKVPVSRMEKKSGSPSESKQTGPSSILTSSGADPGDTDFGVELMPEEAEKLFLIMFGADASKDILAQWSNQGIRFSPDRETYIGLVQYEGGPCGVLATIQAFIFKYILFFPHELKNSMDLLAPYSFPLMQDECHSPSMDNFSCLSEDKRTRALVLSILEMLFMCGSNKRAVIASLNHVGGHSVGEALRFDKKDECTAQALDGLQIGSALDMQRIVRIYSYASWRSALIQLELILPVFQSRLGALLFLISALLSRGLDMVQLDRDDPSLPLVTAPFGHASQEIVNLLLCGRAVPNVFDGEMDLGGGMSLKGIPTNVEVGFLSLMESYNFCKVGQHLKCPKWPIWVVGSESHYTVLFALHPAVQEENELEQRGSLVRRLFDAQDQSGGGGFISVEGLHQVLREANISLSSEKLENLCSMGFIVWSEFWHALLELDKCLGGLKDPTGLMGKKQFDLYHFNGIAKSVINGNFVIDGESPLQRPRLSKLQVIVPPKWTPGEFMMEDVSGSSLGSGQGETGSSKQANQTEQHAPLVDCIRTRWPQAICSWTGDPPSIV